MKSCFRCLSDEERRQMINNIKSPLGTLEDVIFFKILVRKVPIFTKEMTVGIHQGTKRKQLIGQDLVHSFPVMLPEYIFSWLNRLALLLCCLASIKFAFLFEQTSKTLNNGLNAAIFLHHFLMMSATLYIISCFDLATHFQVYLLFFSLFGGKEQHPARFFQKLSIFLVFIVAPVVRSALWVLFTSLSILVQSIIALVNE